MTNTRRGPAVEPSEIVQEGERGLRITWGDGRECRFAAAELRRACPCAQCVNEWTGEQVLRPDSVPEDLTVEGVEIVGRYALNFRWGDGHQTGIYSFRLLRELCEDGEREPSTANRE